jgi:transcriptional regulator with XRE-family HTH domain
LSQLSLALSAGISARHLSFVETGRSRPGREVLVKLAAALELTDEERQRLLAGAGYILDVPVAVEPTNAALTGSAAVVRPVLASLDPHPSVLVDARWDILMPNAGYVRLEQLLLGSSGCRGGAFEFTECPRPNRLRDLMAPQARRSITNWPVLATALRSRLEAEALLSGDPAVEALCREWAPLGIPAPSGGERFPLRVELRIGGVTVHLFSLVTGWARQLPGMRIETLHPVDDPSERALRTLLGPLPLPPRDHRRRPTHSSRRIEIRRARAIAADSLYLGECAELRPHSPSARRNAGGRRVSRDG